LGDLANHVLRNRETYADIAAGRPNHPGNYVRKSAPQIDKRATGIAWIDRRVGLDELRSGRVADLELGTGGRYTRLPLPAVLQRLVGRRTLSALACGGSGLSF
jgi:hypothetical protein